MIAAVDVVETAAESIDWLVLIVGFVGGLALFLYGLDRLTESLRVVAGDRARQILERLTRNRFAGLLTGAGLTAVVQSSSVTTVLLVGFVSAGLMAFVQTIPVILGSNVGTTVTAQIIAFDVAGWALGIVAVGYLVAAIARKRTQRARGMAVLGLGLVFLGMTVMAESMDPLRAYEPFISAMEALDTALLAVAVGALFTAVVQSSSATTGVVIVLAGQGLISLEAGIALVLGANVGTAVTAVLAAIGKPREAQRVAAAHVLFNVFGVLLWLPFIDVLARFVMEIGGGLQREIANAHTVFNVINALIVLPFIAPFARLIERIVPERPSSGTLTARYIDASLLETPALAMAKARMEMMRMASRVQDMLASILPAILDGDRDQLERIEDLDDEVDELHGVIVEFLGEVSKRELSDEVSAELVDLLEATNALEAIGDIIETNLVAIGLRRIEVGIDVSEVTRDRIEGYHRSIQHALQLALVAVMQKDPQAAHDVDARKKSINRRETEIRERLGERLIADAAHRTATYAIETDLVAQLRRVFYFVRRIARVAVPESDQATLGSGSESTAI